MEVEAISLSAEQKNFLAEYGVVYDFDNITFDDACDLEDKVAEILLDYGIEDDYRENEIGEMAQSILFVLAQ